MADICNRCGNEYEDTLGIGKCPECFYGKSTPLPPTTDLEGMAKELVAKFAATIHMASGMHSTLAAKQCAIIHCKLMIEAESEGEIIPHGIERIRHYQNLIKQIEAL